MDGIYYSLHIPATLLQPAAITFHLLLLLFASVHIPVQHVHAKVGTVAVTQKSASGVRGPGELPMRWDISIVDQIKTTHGSLHLLSARATILWRRRNKCIVFCAAHKTNIYELKCSPSFWGLCCQSLLLYWSVGRIQVELFIVCLYFLFFLED